MMKRIAQAAVPVAIAITAIFFIWPSQNAQAAWILRNSTAVNVVSVCTNGVYLGVGAQNNATSVTVNARIYPDNDISVFNETFTLPANPVPELFLTHSDFFFVEWDAPHQPLEVGTIVNFGSTFIDVYGTVGECELDLNTETVSDGFTYQGYLEDGGQPANGVYDFSFRLHDGPAGAAVTSFRPVQDVLVEDGLFTVNIDFTEEAFTGDQRWLGIWVREGASTGAYTGLSPYQEITSVPYASGLIPGAAIEGSSLDTSTLRLNNDLGDALQIDSGLNAITIGVANGNGIEIQHADNAGVLVNNAGTYGIYGRSTITFGVGVRGVADEFASYGVRGSSNSDDGAGVYGTSPNRGVYGSSSNYGVYGFSNSGTGVIGTGFGNEYGVLGRTSDTSGIPVAGLQNNISESDALTSFWRPGGLFSGRNGIIGHTETSGGYAVFGRHSGPDGSGWAGRFSSTNADGVWVSTPSGEVGLSVTGGSKNAVVATKDGARLMYTEESTEVWFTDYGFGLLSGESVEIEIDPIFADTVNLDFPYHVFLQVYGDANLYVTNRTSTSFEVISSDGTISGVEFSYRIVAKRLGFEDDRLERAEFADRDPNLFPERAGEIYQQGD